MTGLAPRAGLFGGVATQYDTFRPRYPVAMVDDLVGGRRPRVLDVGCGTGIAAAAFRARGCDVLGVEADARMAAVARGKGIPVEVSPFERWLPQGRTYDLVTAGQSWHWVDPVLGPERAADALRHGGRLALFWNHERPEPAAREAIDRILGPPAWAPPRLSLGGRFTPATMRLYQWTRTYTRDEWVGQLATYSHHLMLPPDERDRLLAGLGAVVDGLGGRMAVTYETVLLTATRR